MTRGPQHPAGRASLTPRALPTRDGVGASRVSVTAGPWSTLLEFLAVRMPGISLDEWAQRMTEGRVLDDAGQPVSVEAPFRAGQHLHYYRDIPDEPVIPFEETILFQDDWLVVADKPHFLPVTPTGRYVQQSLLVRLKRRLGIDTLTPIHRIDRETAGLVLFAVQPATRDAYHALFRDRVVSKTYEALAPAPGALAFPRIHRSRMVDDEHAFFRMVEAPGEPNSETWIDVLEIRGGFARYRLQPLTGRRHQLRVNMNALGLPIMGDQLYPGVLRGPGEPDDFRRPLQLLASAIAFNDPVTGGLRTFQSRCSLDWHMAEAA
jgi:tRNA pseudouridine32 synthase / 23S rRNA pseudouridine746 synthase